MEKVGQVLNLGERGDKKNSTRDLKNIRMVVYPTKKTELQMKLIVTGLETFLGLSLAEDEVTFWMGMLGDYEPWRLAELKSYRLDERGYGRTLAHICKWLD